MPPHTHLSPERISRLGTGFQASQIVRAALEHRVFTVLSEGHRTADAVAQAAAIDRRATAMLLDALTGLELLIKHHNGEYVLTPETETFLVEGRPTYLGESIVSTIVLAYDKWAHLSETVKTGQPWSHVHDQQEAESFFPRLVRGLYPRMHGPAVQVAEHLKLIGWLPAAPRVLDVGAGSAVWSLPYPKADEGARVTALDLPTVIPITREFAAREQVADRFDYLAGNYFEVPLPQATYDVVMLGNICHSESPEDNQCLFERLGGAMKPQGVLVIADMIPNETRTAPPFPMIWAITMLLNTPSGNAWTYSEYSRWLTAAGFHDIVQFEVTGYHSPIIVAKK
ncbi:MAG: methyltransferase [Candidatus Xenobia bacterium]